MELRDNEKRTTHRQYSRVEQVTDELGYYEQDDIDYKNLVRCPIMSEIV